MVSCNAPYIQYRDGIKIFPILIFKCKTFLLLYDKRISDKSKFSTFAHYLTASTTYGICVYIKNSSLYYSIHHSVVMQ